MTTLLGHDVRTMSPVSVKGSLIGSVSTPTRSGAKVIFPPPKSVPTVDDDEANFVMIDSKYEFNPSKMNDHQKEVMRKRRSDIPALYQDLSQSQTNSVDMFRSESSSQSNKPLTNGTSTPEQQLKPPEAKGIIICPPMLKTNVDFFSI